MQIRHDIIQKTKAHIYCREPYKVKITRSAIEAYLANKLIVCHHVNGEPFTGFSKKDLIKMNMYENRPASELKILSSSEHTILHNSNNTYMKGKHHTEETKKTISEKTSGKKRTAETCKRISATKIGNKNCVGRILSYKTRHKISESNMGKKMGSWYNNGLINVRRTECPVGFVKGRIARG